MSCQGCVGSVERVLRAIDGVEHASVSLEQSAATISFDAQRTGLDAFRQAVEAAGFEAG